MAKQKYFGVDGEIRFVPETGYWIGFMGGKVVATRNNREAVANYLTLKGRKPSNVKKVRSSAEVMSVGLHKKLRDQVATVWADAQSKFYAVKHRVMPSVGFYTRGRTAGKAWIQKHHVEFNEILAQENQDDFFNTVIHEVAHIVTNAVYPGASAHGREFKSIMRELGGDGKRCHSYDVSNVHGLRTKKRFIYACGCKKDHKLTSNEHKKVTLKTHGYRCRLCGNSLTFTNQVIAIV